MRCSVARDETDGLQAHLHLTSTGTSSLCGPDQFPKSLQQRLDSTNRKNLWSKYVYSFELQKVERTAAALNVFLTRSMQEPKES